MIKRIYLNETLLTNYLITSQETCATMDNTNFGKFGFPNSCKLSWPFEFSYTPLLFRVGNFCTQMNFLDL